MNKGLEIGHHCAFVYPSNYLCYAISRYSADCKIRNYIWNSPWVLKIWLYFYWADGIFQTCGGDPTKSCCTSSVTTMKIEQNNWYSIDNIFKYISLNIYILLILMKFHWQVFLSVYLIIKIHYTVWHWKAMVIELICSVVFESSHLPKA